VPYETDFVNNRLCENECSCREPIYFRGFRGKTLKPTAKKIDIAATLTTKDDIQNLGTNGVIEIELPIKFEEAQTINTSYFEMENSISLSGKYINSSEIGKTITSDPISTKLRWTESTVKVGWNGSIEKIIALDDKVLVQAEIESTYKETYFPKESEKVTISVPKVKGITPSYVVLADGEKLDTSKITDNITTQNIT
jgi:hypothetical protein